MKSAVKWTIHALLILAILSLIAFFLYPKITGKAIFRSPIIAPDDSTTGGESSTSVSTTPLGDCYCDCVSTEGLGILIENKKTREDIPERICDAITGESCSQVRYVENVRYIYLAEWDCDWDQTFPKKLEEPEEKSFWKRFFNFKRLSPVNEDGSIRWFDPVWKE